MIAMFFFVLLAFSACANANHLLYVWGGSTKGDFLAVIDYDHESPYYGDVVHKTVLPDSGNVKSTGNEPHHMHIGGDNEYIVAGGLMSFAQGSDEIFVFTLDPKTKYPEFKYSLDVPGGCVDEFVPLPHSNTEFIVTMMCNETGGAPGTLVWIDVATGEFKEWINRSAVGDAFNPHGGGYDPKAGLVVTDYVLPVSLFSDKFVFRDTLHHFNPDGTLNSVIPMPSTNGGFMDFKFITPNQQGVTCSLQENIIYLVEPLKPEGEKVTPIFDLFNVNGGVPVLSAGIMAPSKRGDRLFMSYGLRYVVMFGYDPADPTDLKMLHSFDFCDKKNGLVAVHKVCEETNNMPGTHWISLTPEEDRFFVLNYFVTVGNANLPGSQTVHSFSVDPDYNSFQLEGWFSPYISFGGAMGEPHMAVQIAWDHSGSALVLPSLVITLLLALRALIVV